MLNSLIWAIIFVFSFNINAEDQIARAKDNLECTYMFEKSTLDFKWTGYKYSEKAPVSGTFKDIAFDYEISDSIQKLLTSSKITLSELKIDSKNEIRDKNLISSIFKYTIGDEIRAKINAVNLTGKKVKIQLFWNNKIYKLTGDLNLDPKKESFKISTVIDLKYLNLLDSYKSLSKTCEQLHTGKDGKSVTWSDILITVSGSFRSNCIE